MTLKDEDNKYIVNCKHSQTCNNREMMRLRKMSLSFKRMY